MSRNDADGLMIRLREDGSQLALEAMVRIHRMEQSLRGMRKLGESILSSRAIAQPTLDSVASSLISEARRGLEEKCDYIPHNGPVTTSMEWVIVHNDGTPIAYIPEVVRQSAPVNTEDLARTVMVALNHAVPW